MVAFKKYIDDLNKSLEIVWSIYWTDVCLMTFSFLIALTLRLEANIFDYSMFFIVRYLMSFFLIAMSVCLWCQTYKPLWGTPLQIRGLVLAACASYLIFCPLFMMMGTEDNVLPVGSLGIGFFIALLFLLLPRILAFSSFKTTLKAEPVIIVGCLKTLQEYCVWMQNAGYPIQAAVALDYTGPERRMGNVPLTMLEKCPQGKRLAILEENIEEKDLRILQSLVEYYGMQLLSIQKYLHVEELAID